MAIIAATLPAFTVSATAPSREFASETGHFRVRYPGSWHRLADRNDVLNIINFPGNQAVEGVILNATGAMIQVSGPPPKARTVEDWIRIGLLDDPLLDKREVPPSNDARGCKTLTRVQWRSDVSGQGKAYYFYTDYYCSTASGFYSVLLTNWEGDTNQRHLEQTALAIALSLRVW
jgi:hypothetical protein